VRLIGQFCPFHFFLEFPMTTTECFEVSEVATANVSRQERGTFFTSLNRLILSPQNVRKVEPTGINELAQMIASQGLLNPLIVTVNSTQDGVTLYAVEAGGRRLRALQMLAQEGMISQDWPIECKLIDSDSALEVSLAENIAQEGMHPADEFEAYQALAQSGMPIAAISKKFGVTEVHVQRRLKMSAVAPELFALYRNNEMTMDQLMALASTDDKALQVRVWNTLPNYQRSAYYLKKQLFQDEVNTKDKRLKIVSLDDYKAAGGEVRVDLFSEDGDELITDPTLLDELVAKALEQKKADLLAEGWGWVEVSPTPVYSYNLREKYVMFKPDPRDPTEAEQKKLDDLESRLKGVEDKITDMDDMDSDDEDFDSDAYRKLSEEQESLEQEIQELKSTFFDTSYPDRGNSGVIVFADSDGIKCHFGLQAKNGLGGADSAGGGSVSGVASAKETNEFSEKMVQNLTSHTTAALQASMLANPNVALAAAATRFAVALFDHDHFRNPVKISLVLAKHELTKNSDSVAASKGFQKTEAAIARWKSMLPADQETWLQWFIDQPQGASIEMIVLGTALSTTAVHGNTTNYAPKAEVLKKAVALDMSQWWEATPETYLNPLPKTKIIEAVVQATSEKDAEPMAKMKKGEAVTYAAAKLAGTGWLPSILKA